MVKARIKFSRGEELRFLSHLDQQRLFGRALRRADLPMAFSQGFNPHPIISFANAMSVGMTSDCEYVDIGLDVPNGQHINAKQVRKALQNAMPTGIKILDVDIISDQSKSLTRMIQYADYDVICLDLHVSDFNEFEDALNKFSEQKVIEFSKKNKKGKLVNKNIRENFENIETEKDNKNVIFHIRILPISGSLLSPETIIKIFLNSINYYDNSLNIITHRRDLKIDEN